MLTEGCHRCKGDKEEGKQIKQHIFGQCALFFEKVQMGEQYGASFKKDDRSADDEHDKEIGIKKLHFRISNFYMPKML